MVNPRRLLINQAQGANLERRIRMKYTARVHAGLARLTAQQANLHRAVATLLRREAIVHRHCTKLDWQAIRRQSTQGRALSFFVFGKQHLQQVDGARKEAWAHQQLAARSQTRALWHKSVANLLATRSGVL